MLHLAENAIELEAPLPNLRDSPSSLPCIEPETAFGYPRDFLGNRFVYAMVSPRAGGLSIGVNMNPDKKCNFDCLYCEVNRREIARESCLDVDVMAAELKRTLAAVCAGELRQRFPYRNLPNELTRFHHVTLSGDGEPTMAPRFLKALQAVIHIRGHAGFPFFKMVLLTNSTGLDQPQVQHGLKLMGPRDEIWAKLDGGTQAYLNEINRPDVPVEKILANILSVGRERPVIIQSLFPSIHGVEPSADEIMHYVKRLAELKSRGAQISLVQIYSATRPMPRTGCGHLRLRALYGIARAVHAATGLKVEVF